jgi:hypothetical protein
MALMTFADALADAERFKGKHLLLGNGFSIACRPNIFVYGRLFEQADFSSLSPAARQAFVALGTQDFEKVIKALRDTRSVLSAYSDVNPVFLEILQRDADGIREVLVNTIAQSHPAWPGEIENYEYESCKKFLANFKDVYTFNYDLLLYWTQMHNAEGEEPWADDGFRKSPDNPDAPYVVWDPNTSRMQNSWFLHGALHIFDANVEIQKYTWINTQIRLVDQIREALSNDIFPLFVAEGRSSEKLERILHSGYLSKAYRSFSSISDSLFIYGHSLADNDNHYLQRIERGKLSQLYVGLYGDINGPENKAIIQRANQMIHRRRGNRALGVSYYDASTANVWGH